MDGEEGGVLEAGGGDEVVLNGYGAGVERTEEDGEAEDEFEALLSKTMSESVEKTKIARATTQVGGGWSQYRNSSRLHSGCGLCLVCVPPRCMYVLVLVFGGLVVVCRRCWMEENRAWNTAKPDVCDDFAFCLFSAFFFVLSCVCTRATLCSGVGSDRSESTDVYVLPSVPTRCCCSGDGPHGGANGTQEHQRQGCRPRSAANG